MKVTLFGATGRTGPFLIAEGLRRGADLTVVARHGSTFTHPGVRVLRGELTDLPLLRDAVGGADAVISALGPISLSHPADLPITRATQAYTAVMAQEGVRRLVAVSTGTAPDPQDGFDWKIRLPAPLIRAAMPGAYRDMLGLAQAVRAAPVDWTLVRLAVLTGRPTVARLNVGLYGHTQHSWTIPRANVAAFLFDQISNPASIRKAPGISAG